MRVVSLQCKDFKCFTDRTFTFADQTKIQAENGKGKTSIAEAFMFALYGANITGSAVGIDDYIRKGTKSMEVEVALEIGTVHHVIARTKGKTSAVYLDGHKSDNNEIARLIGDKAEFLSVFTPGYFAALSNTDARTMVMQLVKMPEKADVLNRMDKHEQNVLSHEALRDPDGWAKQLRDDIKAAQKEQERARGQIELLEPRVNAEIPQRWQMSDWDAHELSELLARRESERTTNADQARHIKERIGELRRQYTYNQTKLQRAPETPYKVGEECPTCKVLFTEESLKDALHTHTLLAAKIEDANDTHRRAMSGIEAQGKSLAEELNRLSETSLQEGDAVLDARIAELETIKNQIDQHNAEVQATLRHIEADKDALNEAQGKLADYEQEESRLQSVIRALALYRAKLAEMQVEQLTQHLDKVSIQLFDVVKSTGEIKPTFDLLYEGREYRTLSYSERIRANLEIATLINRVRGYDWPIFIDNCESITHYVRPAATQVIEAHVVAESELTVSTKGADAA